MRVFFPADPTKGSGDPFKSVPGTGESFPTGIESQFSYNGLTLNDTSVVDKYRILSIQGRDDADVRDSREDNIAEDGETAYDSFYGGRTLVLEVRIEAYTLNKLRDMEYALKEAFSTLEEKPLYFLTGNSTKDHYINCRKIAKIQSTEEQKLLNNFYRDYQITLRASNPRFFKVAFKSLTIFPNKVIDGNFETDTASAQPSTWKKLGASGFPGPTLTSQNWAINGTKSLRIQAFKDNTAIQRNFFVGTASGTAGLVVGAGTTYCLQLAGNFPNPANQSNFARIAWYNGNTFLSYTDGTSIGGASAASAVSILFASGIAPASATYAAVGISGNSVTPNDIVDEYIDNVWFVETDGKNNVPIPPGQVQAVNDGNYTTQPIITIYGGLTIVNIQNQTTQQSLELASGLAIVDGNFYKADSKNNTLIDSTSLNKFQDLKSTSDLPKIVPGANLFSVKVDNTIGSSINSKVVIQFSDAYI